MLIQQRYLAPGSYCEIDIDNSTKSKLNLIIEQLSLRAADNVESVDSSFARDLFNPAIPHCEAILNETLGAFLKSSEYENYLKGLRNKMERSGGLQELAVFGDTTPKPRRNKSTK
jgi:hypothetical protein